MFWFRVKNFLMPWRVRHARLACKVHHTGRQVGLIVEEVFVMQRQIAELQEATHQLQTTLERTRSILNGDPSVN